MSTCLLLESSGNKPSQLHQTGVDPVTSPLLNDLQEKNIGKPHYLQAFYSWISLIVEQASSITILTPRRFFLDTT